MQGLWQDVKSAVRLLLKRPGFTLVAVLSLTLGIGANSTVFTLINAVFLRPIPVRDPARAVYLFTQDARNAGQGYLPTSYINLHDIEQKNSVFSGFSTVLPNGANWLYHGHTQTVPVELVNAGFFSMLGENIAPGRNFLPQEDGAPGAHPVVILSHGFWVKQLGGSADVIGQSVNLDGLDYTVVGVAPADFQNISGIGDPAMWAPLAMHDQILTGIVKGWFNQRRPAFAGAIARLKPGVTLRQAQQEVRALAAQLARQYPTDDAGRTIALVPMTEGTVGPNARPIFLLAGTVMMVIAGLVLLIACANVANLLLVRAAQRRREFAVRLALGAGRGRLVRQLLAESLVLGVAAGGCALGFAYVGKNALWALRPPGFGGNLTLSLNAPVLAFTFGLALLATVIFGLAPALQATRPEQTNYLRDRTDPPSGGIHWYSLRGLLVAAQVAFSLIALVGASLFIHSLVNAQHVNLGFDGAHLVFLRPRFNGQTPLPRIQQFDRDAAARLRTLPQVAAASVADTMPLQGGLERTTFPAGVDTSDTRNGKLTPIIAVRPGYFQTMGIPLLRGRDFSDADGPTSALVAVINTTLAHRLWPGQNPLGKHLRFLQETWDVTVVGEVPTVKYANLGESPQAQVYFALDQQPAPGLLVVRTKGDPAQVLPNVRAVVQGMDPNLQPLQTTTLAELTAQQLEGPALVAELLTAFGLLALLLAAVGTYGVMSYSVSQRTREIGVRIALGARAADVMRLVLGSGMAMVAAGAGLGLALALLLSRGLGAVLVGIAGFDLPSFVFAPLVLLLVALLACWLPARRALGVDPLTALRDE